MKTPTLNQLITRRHQEIKREIKSLTKKLNDLTEQLTLIETIKPKAKPVKVKKPKAKQPEAKKSKTQVVEICLYEHTRDTLGCQFDKPIIAINNNPTIRETTIDLLKNNFDIKVIDDSKNPEGKAILDSYENFLRSLT